MSDETCECGLFEMGCHYVRYDALEHYHTRTHCAPVVKSPPDPEEEVARLQRENARLRSRLARVLMFAPAVRPMHICGDRFYVQRGHVWSAGVPGGRRNER